MLCKQIRVNKLLYVHIHMLWLTCKYGMGMHLISHFFCKLFSLKNAKKITFLICYHLSLWYIIYGLYYMAHIWGNFTSHWWISGPDIKRYVYQISDKRPDSRYIPCNLQLMDDCGRREIICDTIFSPSWQGSRVWQRHGEISFNHIFQP